MSLEVQIHEADTHLSIKAMGHYSLANLYGLFDKVKIENGKRAGKGVILDVTEVAGTIPFMHLHALGEYCPRVWPLPLRIAIVSPEGGLNKFFENVAWNRGVRVAVVPNQGAAMEWVNWDP
ncbi:MAG: hypothetical protein ABSA59_19990 [Terriglobia bacterium]|jgi:hypothetical protein